jgi:DNA-binding response OmpR family regulator
MAISVINKVMLVEDDASMQSVLRTLLELEGFKVVIAPDNRSGEEIVDFVRSEQPDVLLLDVHLGKISGIDILRQLRANAQTQKTRIVMTSGMDVKDQCINCGADTFLMKPYMPDELIRKLRG